MSVLCPPTAPEREQTQSQHEQLLVCTVRSLVETNIMQLCRLCRLMCCHCEMRPPRVTAPACPPFLPRPRTSPLMLRIPAKSTLGGSDHFSCSMYGWVPLFLSVEPLFLRLFTCHMHVTAGAQPGSKPILGWTPLWRRHTGSRAARPCGGILYVRKLSLQRTQVCDGTIFSYRRLRDYDAQVRKPVGLSAALILLSSFAVRSVSCDDLCYLERQLSFQGEGWLTHDGSQFPFVTFRRHFKSGDPVIFRNFTWSSRFDDLAECVGVQLKDS